ncbi:hypothetical protein KI387_031279, partial [Taxus chinensis]
VYDDKQETFEREAEGYERMARLKGGSSISNVDLDTSRSVNAGKTEDIFADDDGEARQSYSSAAPSGSVSENFSDTVDIFGESDASATVDIFSESQISISRPTVQGAASQSGHGVDESTLSASNTDTSGAPSDYVYDESSGYYYSSKLGYYYDPSTGLFCSATTGQCTSGEIILLGDFNARTANNQSLQLTSLEGGEDNLLWFKEEENKLWERLSQDDSGGVSHFGVELLGLCSLYNMVICNGMRAWPRLGNITCKTYNGQSVVDYVICSQSFISTLLEFEIGDCPIELKSDHRPLLVKLGTAFNQQQRNQAHHMQKASQKQGKIILNKENQGIFVAALKQQLQIMRKDIENTASKGSSDYIPSNLLISLIQKALTVCERSKPRKRVANTFPTNPWYDEECKAAKRALKENGMNKENKKIYERLVQHKKESYVCKKRTELISLGKHNPKGFWKELQQKKKYIENNITGAHWLEYARTLYERPQQKDVPPIIETSTELFSTEDIKQGIKNLANGKAQDIDGLQAEFLKWGVEVLTPHIRKILIDVNQNGFPTEWTTNVVIPLFKSGDINNPSNYRTIMINPLLGKLFGGMIEQRISSWAEREGKRAKGQAVPRKKLWDRMEELGIPDELRAAVHKLYEQVRAKIKTREGMSECFGSNIGVKQGCPLSPTLFGLYIDKLEDWLNKTEGGGIQLASFVVKLLLYADDLILISKIAQGLREQLKALELFCQEVGMQVNTSKNKNHDFHIEKERETKHLPF